MSSLLCLLALVPAAVAVDRTRPHIVIVYCDDLGYADIGPFGAKTIKTPHLDQLAREGRSFTRFHVAQPVCSASRTALLTGCYPNRLGLHGALGPNAKHGIAATEETLGELAKRAGYQTAAVGKWHLGHHPEFLPTRHGFDRYFGLPYSNDMWPFHPEAKPGSYPDLPLFENETVINPRVGPADQERLTGQYTDKAIEFIQNSLKGNKPFFLYLAHSMPHVPLFAGDRFKGKSNAGTYGDVIEEIDDSVGRIIATLKAKGAWENTLLIFTSDNGPWLSYGNHAGNAGPFREGKGTCFEGGVRVPCIMSWPGMVEPGTRDDANFMTIDILPTIAGRLGLEPKGPSVDGKDVWKWINRIGDPKHPQKGYAFYYEVNQLQAVSTADGKFKLHLPHTYRTLAGREGGKDGKPARYETRKIETPELYNLDEDPGETNNIASAHPQIVKELLALATSYRDDMGDSLTKIPGQGNRQPGRVKVDARGFPIVDNLPGIPIAYSPASSGKYIGSPSIAILPSGEYLASHDFFSRTNTGSITRVYLSRDRGQSWVDQAEIQGAWWSGLFTHKDAVYLMGVDQQYGRVVIRKSTDKGKTWTQPRDGKSGVLIAEGKYHTSAMPVIIHQGRVWRTMEDGMGPGGWGSHFRSFLLSAPVDADLLDASQWTASNRIGRDPTWLGGNFGGFLEGNAVVGPDGNLINLLRADYRKGPEHAALIRVSQDGKTASFDPQTGFFPFPGGCKKFLIRRDPRDGSYWVMTNWVPPSQQNANPERTRNTLVLAHSPDLKQWDIRGVVASHPDRATHGYQYPDWLFDGEDLVAVVRTAHDDNGAGARNQHDANWMTFHRIANFRNWKTDLPK